MMKSGKWRENKWEWLQNACLMQLPSQPLQVACYPSHMTQTCQEFPIFLLSHRDTLESFRLSQVTSPLKCLLSPTFFSLFPPCLFLDPAPSLANATLAAAQQLLFSDRSVKQEMMRSWKIDLEAALSPCSRSLLFCISDGTSGIHLVVIICY